MTEAEMQQLADEAARHVRAELEKSPDRTPSGIDIRVTYPRGGDR